MQHSLDPTKRILLLGCGKTKRSTSAPASELYTGGLFSARRRYAEASACRWLIVSARYGLVAPNVVLQPYDLRVSDLSALSRAAWSLAVVSDFIATLDDCKPSDVSLDLHMGADYFEPLAAVLGALGFRFTVPTRGLSQGEQLAWYATTGARQ